MSVKQPIKIKNKKKEDARIATVDFARYNRANNGDNMNNLNKGNIKVKKYNSATKLLIGLHIGFLLICAIFLSLSLSMLSDSKTAVGSVTFDLESPSIALDNGLQLNYNGQVGSSGTLTYTNDAGVETDINNLSLNLTIPQENMFNQYYVKLIYDFSAVNVGTITFGANDYTLTSGQMSAMTTTGTTNEFYSISGTTNSPQALAKGISLNIFEFLKQFKYAHTEAVDTIFNFNIAIIVDTASSCQSTNRSQTIINGKLYLENYQYIIPSIEDYGDMMYLLIGNDGIVHLKDSTVGELQSNILKFNGTPTTWKIEFSFKPSSDWFDEIEVPRKSYNENVYYQNELFETETSNITIEIINLNEVDLLPIFKQLFIDMNYVSKKTGHINKSATFTFSYLENGEFIEYSSKDYRIGIAIGPY